VVIEQAPPHRIRIRGLVEEKMFKLGAFELWTEVSTLPFEPTLRIDDELVNRSAYAQEFQLIYHANFVARFSNKGARFEAPIDTLFSVLFRSRSRKLRRLPRTNTALR